MQQNNVQFLPRTTTCVLDVASFPSTLNIGRSSPYTLLVHVWFPSFQCFTWNEQVQFASKELNAEELNAFVAWLLSYHCFL